MHYFGDATIEKGIAIHKVGNKMNNEALVLSQQLVEPDDKLQNVLLQYFLNQFKEAEYFNFYHDSDLQLNEVFVYVSAIFDNPQTLFEQSQNIAKHLYEMSVHPKINSGEFYTVHFSNCQINGQTVDAVGLFKSENKETFLKVLHSAQGYALESEEGINIHKLDKGCIIFNTERDNGFVVSVVDNVNRGTEALYWIDDFLHIRQRKDEYSNTHNVLSMYKNFVTKELPQQFEVSKADQADLLNRSVDFFKEKEKFDMGEFADAVIAQPALIDSFNRYKTDYQNEHSVEFDDSFDISGAAVKKQARIFKSVIKLDKNFHIYVHGNRNLIEQGEDDKGKFYKIYFKEES